MFNRTTDGAVWTAVIPETRFTLRLTAMLVWDTGIALSNGLWSVGYRWRSPLQALPRGFFYWDMSKRVPKVERTQLLLAGPRAPSVPRGWESV